MQGPLDSSAGPWTVVLLIAYALLVFAVLSCIAKGKFGFVLLAVVTPPIGIPLCCIGAIRLAKPRSWWARHMYESREMEASIQRHEPPMEIETIQSPEESSDVHISR